MRMRWVGALGALIAVVVVTVMGAMPAAAGSNGNSKFSKHDRALLIEQSADGATSTTLVVAAKSGLSASVADALVALGGTIGYRDDALGYVRVSLSIENAYAAAKLDGIEAVDVDEVLPLPSPRPEAADPTPDVDPPGSGTPVLNPYMPTRDTGAPQFVAANPTYDGRGVTIGILDTGIDLLTPELQTAKSKTGASQRKIIDWVTFTDPLTDDDPTWVITGTAVSPGSERPLHRRREHLHRSPERATSSSARSSRAIRVSAASSATTSTATVTPPTSSASSVTRAASGSIPTRTSASPTSTT